jgi:hypothetical protein
MPSNVFAQAITFTINGSPSNDTTVQTGTDASGHPISWVNIGGPYTFGTSPNDYRIQIDPISTSGSPPDNQARVEVVNDNGIDLLSLENAKISVVPLTTPFAGGLNIEHHITFSGTLTNEPHTDAGSSPVVDVNYEVFGMSNTGTLTRVNPNTPATNDVVRAQGSVKFPADSGTPRQIITSSGTSELKKTICANPAATCLKFFSSSLDMLWGHNPELTGSRVVQGDFWFTVTNKNDLVSFPTTQGGLQLKTTPVGIPGGNHHCLKCVECKQGQSCPRHRECQKKFTCERELIIH